MLGPPHARSELAFFRADHIKVDRGGFQFRMPQPALHQCQRHARSHGRYPEDRITAATLWQLAGLLDVACDRFFEGVPEPAIRLVCHDSMLS